MNIETATYSPITRDWQRVGLGSGSSPLDTPLEISRCAATDAFELSADAAVALRRLNLAAAKRMAYDALETARATLGNTSVAAAFAAAIIAQIAYEEGDYRGCDNILQTVFKTPGERASPAGLVRAYPVAARIMIHGGDEAGALQKLYEGAALGQSRGSVWLLVTCLRELVHLHIDAGDLDRARHLLGRLTRVASIERSARMAIEVEMVGARLTLAATPSREAAAVLLRLHDDACARKDLRLAATLELRLAEALQINGDTIQAQTLITDALHKAMHTGLFQTWIDSGPHIHRLLRLIYTQSEPSQHDFGPFLRTIIRRLSAPSSPLQSHRHPLSARESHILQLMSRGLTNKGIARDLCIAPETVKAHVKRIFQKLQAHTRSEAVARAFGWSPLCGCQR